MRVPFRWVLAAAAGSSVGDGVRDAALPLVSLAVLGDPFQVTLVVAANQLPWLLLTLPAGVWADRFDRRRLMVLADLLRAGALALGGVLLVAGRLQLASLCAVASVLGAGSVVFSCASFALLPEIAPDGRLEPANAKLLGVQTLGGQLLGRTLGGVLFAAGAALPLLVDGASFLASALLLAQVRDVAVRRALVRASLLKEAAAGVRFLLADRLLVVLTVAACLVNFVWGGESAIFVVLAEHVLRLSPAVYGTLLAMIGLGGLAGGAAAVRLTAWLGKGPALLAGPLLCGVASLAIALATTEYPVGVAFFAAGFGLMVWNVVSVSTRQAAIPSALRGRVMGVYRLFIFGALPLGASVFGTLAETAGPRAAFGIGAALLLLVGVSSLPFLVRTMGGRRLIAV